MDSTSREELDGLMQQFPGPVPIRQAVGTRRLRDSFGCNSGAEVIAAQLGWVIAAVAAPIRGDVGVVFGRPWASVARSGARRREPEN